MSSPRVNKDVRTVVFLIVGFFGLLAILSLDDKPPQKGLPPLDSQQIQRLAEVLAAGHDAYWAKQPKEDYERYINGLRR